MKLWFTRKLWIYRQCFKNKNYVWNQFKTQCSIKIDHVQDSLECIKIIPSGSSLLKIVKYTSMNIQNWVYRCIVNTRNYFYIMCSYPSNINLVRQINTTFDPLSWRCKKSSTIYRSVLHWVVSMCNNHVHFTADTSADIQAHHSTSSVT